MLLESKKDESISNIVPNFVCYDAARIMLNQHNAVLIVFI